MRHFMSIHFFNYHFLLFNNPSLNPGLTTSKLLFFFCKSSSPYQPFILFTFASHTFCSLSYRRRRCPLLFSPFCLRGRRHHRPRIIVIVVVGLTKDYLGSAVGPSVRPSTHWWGEILKVARWVSFVT